MRFWKLIKGILIKNLKRGVNPCVHSHPERRKTVWNGLHTWRKYGNSQKSTNPKVEPMDTNLESKNTPTIISWIMQQIAAKNSKHPTPANHALNNLRTHRRKSSHWKCVFVCAFVIHYILYYETFSDPNPQAPPLWYRKRNALLQLNPWPYLRLVVW